MMFENEREPKSRDIHIYKLQMEKLVLPHWNAHDHCKVVNVPNAELQTLSPPTLRHQV